MTSFRSVASVDDIFPGKGAIVDVDGEKIAVFNVKGVFYALSNACTHRGGPLGEGSLRGTTANCPWHGSQFDVTNGRVLGPPASTPVKSYATKVEEGRVYVAFS
jgi:nitrite reductase/ring-hydroxylating ferredoxin subunit